MATHASAKQYRPVHQFSGRVNKPRPTKVATKIFPRNAHIPRNAYLPRDISMGSNASDTPKPTCTAKSKQNLTFTLASLAISLTHAPAPACRQKNHHSSANSKRHQQQRVHPNFTERRLRQSILSG